MSRKLLAPRFDVDEDSCLQFYYYMQSYHTDDLATFAVSLVNSRERDVLLMPNNTNVSSMCYVNQVYRYYSCSNM